MGIVWFLIHLQGEVHHQHTITPKTPKGKIVTQPMSHFLVHTKTGPWVLPEAVYPSNHPSVWLACQFSRPVSLISSVGDAACDLEARDREPVSPCCIIASFFVSESCVYRMATPPVAGTATLPAPCCTPRHFSESHALF